MIGMVLVVTSTSALLLLGKCDRSVAIRIPATGTHLEDRRPAANINPYTAVNSLLKSLIRAEKSHGRQNASKRTKRKTATVA